MIYLIDAMRNGLPTKFGASNCHCEWDVGEAVWPRDNFRSLMAFIRDHLDEINAEAVQLEELAAPPPVSIGANSPMRHGRRGTI